MFWPCPYSHLGLSENFFWSDTTFLKQDCSFGSIESTL